MKRDPLFIVSDAARGYVPPQFQGKPERVLYLQELHSARGSIAQDLYRCVFARNEVVLYGRSVANAFVCGLDPKLDALARAEFFSNVYLVVPDGKGGWAASIVWLVPEWTRETEHQLSRFLERVLCQLEFPLPPQLPAVLTPDTWEPLAATQCWPKFR